MTTRNTGENVDVTLRGRDSPVTAENPSESLLCDGAFSNSGGHVASCDDEREEKMARASADTTHVVYSVIQDLMDEGCVIDVEEVRENIMIESFFIFYRKFGQLLSVSVLFVCWNVSCCVCAVCSL